MPKISIHRWLSFRGRVNKEGTLHSRGGGKQVTSRKQAVAIALSEARQAGARIPPKSKKKP